jgi:hypothetical protein
VCAAFMVICNGLLDDVVPSTAKELNVYPGLAVGVKVITVPET